MAADVLSRIYLMVDMGRKFPNKNNLLHFSRKNRTVPEQPSAPKNKARPLKLIIRHRYFPLYFSEKPVTCPYPNGFCFSKGFCFSRGVAFSVFIQ
jgi:hypothetical protein